MPASKTVSSNGTQNPPRPSPQEPATILRSTRAKSPIKTDETKDAKLKRDDPHGFGITVLSMGIVFFCLALLYVFFRIFGMIIVHQRSLKKAAEVAASVQPVKAVAKTTEIAAEVAHKTTVVLKDGIQTKGIDREIYMAVIAMALKQYQDDVHDVESGIITIKPRHSMWNNGI